MARDATGADAVARFVDAADLSGGADAAPVEVARWGRAGFTGKAEQVVVVPPGSDVEPVTYLVGVGQDGPQPLDARPDLRVRRAAGALARSLKRHQRLAVVLDGRLGADPHRAALARAVAEGLRLGAHQLTTFKSAPADDSELVVVLAGGGGRRVADALAEGAASARAVALARDLVNTPGGVLTPEALAKEARALGKAHGFGVTVLDERKLAAAGHHGVLAVNQGSVRPPRFVTLTYEPAAGRPRGHLALVGKGITFDSGGLSIKTAAGMMTMKDDMAGAAAVLAAFTRFAEAGVKAKVTGLLPLTDNMPGGDALRPGDIIRYRNGRTVEVLNTDAEGRLVLADALLAAAEHGADAVLDLATLTGAVETALGSKVAALMGNNEAWVTQVEQAAGRVGERSWRLPLLADERPRLDGDAADLRNVGKGAGGGTIVAGLFLQEFVAAGLPWAHLDIAGTAWTEEVRAELNRGGTGYGVRTLVELARTFHRPGAGPARTA